MMPAINQWSSSEMSHDRFSTANNHRLLERKETDQQLWVSYGLVMGLLSPLMQEFG